VDKKITYSCFPNINVHGPRKHLQSILFQQLKILLKTQIQHTSQINMISYCQDKTIIDSSACPKNYPVTTAILIAASELETILCNIDKD
jgi:hypothetical protein